MILDLMKHKRQVFEKLDHDYIRRLGVTKKPTLDYSERRGADVMKLPSLNVGMAEPAFVNSVMDPMSLAKESKETRAAIIAKSKRIAIAYNKGAAQYISDDTDPKTIGRK